MKRIQKGFTLIELMIVVAIIGILAAVAIPAYQDYIVKSKLSKVQSTLDAVKLALAMYNQEWGSFPNATIDTTTASVQGTTPNLWGSIGIPAGQKPVIPSEVSLLAVDGTPLTSVYLTLTIGNGKIRANTIDGKNLVVIGEARATAVTWSCVNASGATVTGLSGLKTVTSVSDPIALKYFQCP